MTSLEGRKFRWHIVSFRCDATIRRRSGTRRTRAVGPIGAFVNSRPQSKRGSILDLARFLEANRFPPRIKSEGRLSLENALLKPNSERLSIYP